jgi:hypothetical protein
MVVRAVLFVPEIHQDQLADAPVVATVMDAAQKSGIGQLEVVILGGVLP